MFSRTTKKRNEVKKCNGNITNSFIDEKHHSKANAPQTKRSSFTQMQSFFHCKGKSVHPTESQTSRIDRIQNSAVAAMDIDPPIEPKNKWKTAVDPKSGKTYYYDTISRKSTWDKPFELCTIEEQRNLKEKERQVKAFFKDMESNILHSYANGNLPLGYFSTTGKITTPLTPTTNSTTTSDNLFCASATHIGSSAVIHSQAFSPVKELRPTQVSPDQVSSFPFGKFNSHSMGKNHNYLGENEFIDEGIEMMQDDNGNLLTSHVRRSKHESTPYSASNDLGRDVTIKCVCTAYRAHIIESTIRYYEGSLECSPTFNDSPADQYSTRLSHSSPLAHPRIRESISQDTDILDLASHYRGEDVPSVDVLVHFFSEIFHKSQMEADCIIMALIYIERVMKKTRDWVRPTVTNWKCFFLSCIMMSSKVWDDLSMINADFANICASMREPISLKRINELELYILHRLKYRVTVTTSEYTKYNVFIGSVMAKRGHRLESDHSMSQRHYRRSLR